MYARAAQNLTAFARSPVGAVLRPVPRDDLVLPVVPPDRERHLQDLVALLHQRQDPLNFRFPLVQVQPAPFDLGQVLHELVLHQHARPVEEVLHHVEEARVGVLGHVLEPLGDDMVGVGPGLVGRRREQLQQRPDLQVRAGLDLRDRLQAQHRGGLVATEELTTDLSTDEFMQHFTTTPPRKVRFLT